MFLNVVIRSNLTRGEIKEKKNVYLWINMSNTLVNMKNSVTQHFNKMLIVLIRQPLVSVLNIITFPNSVYELIFFFF